MENEAPPRRSVAELAGKFKGQAPPTDSGGECRTDKPVRRRPPRTLQLPRATAAAEQSQPPSGASSPPRAKRNSALIEKLQANLTLGSPTAPPPKSPGLRMLPPGFTPPSPGSAPLVTVVTALSPTSPAPTSPSTESPTSFEAPPSSTEGTILPSINKGRARVSIRRRPPSRRHRQSSGDEGAEPSSRTEGEEGEGGEVFKADVPTEAPPTNEEEETTKSVKEEEEGGSSSQQREEEQKTPEEEERRNPTDETAGKETETSS